MASSLVKPTQQVPGLVRDSVAEKKEKMAAATSANVNAMWDGPGFGMLCKCSTNSCLSQNAVFYFLRQGLTL